MLSDSEERAKVKSKRGRAPGAVNKHWSDSQKIEAVTTYLALGNMALVSRVLKIPEFTCREWKKKHWWKEVEDELKVQEELQLSSRLKRIIESALSATEDRIAHGDFIYDNKTGDLRRKPVNLRDVHRVTMDMVDKREKIVNKNVASIPLEQIESKLEKLAKKFEEIAAKKQKIEVTDVLIGSDIPNSTDLNIDEGEDLALYEERKEGL